MRESMGGLFLIKLMVFFIAIYSALLAIAINYAMAYRVKDQIISLLERYEGCQNAKDEIGAYLNDIGYYHTNGKGRIYLIEAVSDNRGTYYRVTTYISFDFPIVGSAFSLKVTGESKIIYGIKEGSAQCASLGVS